MKAYVCHAFGDYHELMIDELPDEPPGPEEVRIDNQAFGIGFPEMLMVQGRYQLRPPLPFVPGMECSGIVTDVGRAVTEFKPGDHVMGTVRFGAFASSVRLSRETCLALPPQFDFVEGAAYSIAYKTAHVALVVRGGLQPGETLLVHGAAGGVGLAAVDLGKALGAIVIGTGSNDEKLEIVKQRGADHVVNCSDGAFRDAIKHLTGGRGADVIYDPVGGDVFDESLHCIAPFGRLLVIGFASGRIAAAPANLALIKQISIIGVRAGAYGRVYPAGGAAVNRAVLDYANKQGFRPLVHTRVQFEDVPAAFDMLTERRSIGRIVGMP